MDSCIIVVYEEKYSVIDVTQRLCVTIQTRDGETPDAKDGVEDAPVAAAAEEDAYRAACRRYARLSGRRR